MGGRIGGRGDGKLVGKGKQKGLVLASDSLIGRGGADRKASGRKGDHFTGKDGQLATTSAAEKSVREKLQICVPLSGGLLEKSA